MRIHNAADFDPVAYLRLRVEGKRRNRMTVKIVALSGLIALITWAITKAIA